MKKAAAYKEEGQLFENIVGGGLDWIHLPRSDDLMLLILELMQLTPYHADVAHIHRQGDQNLTVSVKVTSFFILDLMAYKTPQGLFIKKKNGGKIYLLNFIYDNLHFGAG